jgi:bacteriorhodopsin
MDLQIVQAAFMLGFVAMAAGAFYFFMERGDLKPEHRSVGTYAAVIALIAAIMYYVMKDTVLFPGGMITVAEINATMPLRYIDWLITTPLLLVEFGLIVALAGGAKAGLVTRLVIADLVMIVTGYLGEVGVVGSASNYIFFIISTLAWVYIIMQILRVDVSSGPAYAQRAVKTMRWFVIAGWAIYPIGTAVQQFMGIGGADITQAAAIAAVIYVIADVLNKVGFGIIAVNAAKKA